MQFYEDIPWVLAAGGSKGEVAIWDTEESKHVKKRFGAGLSDAHKKVLEELEGAREIDEADASDNSDFEDISSEDEPRKSKKTKTK